MIACEGILLAKLTEEERMTGKSLVALMATYYVYDVGYSKGPCRHSAVDSGCPDEDE